MPVKVRLTRRGRKKNAIYDVVVADSRSPRDGRFIEKIGTYNPNTNPATINLNDEKAFDWVMKGAQPTDTVKAILSYKGILLKKHLQIGVNKGALTQEEADKKFDAWLKEKSNKIQSGVDKLAKQKESSEKARLESEKKVNEARIEAIRKKKQVAEAALVAEVVESNADESEKVLEEEGKEAVAELEADQVETKKESQTETVEAEAKKTEAETSTEEPVAEKVEVKAKEDAENEDSSSEGKKEESKED